MAQDPYKYFRIEARDIADQLGREVLELEKGSRGPERIAKLLRLAHTLKGAARVVRQREIADVAHAMEDALGQLRDGRAPVTAELAQSLFGMIDTVQQRVAALARAPDVPAADARNGQAPAEAPLLLRADLADIDALLDDLAEVGAELGSLRQCVGGLKGVRRLADVLSERVSARAPGARAGSPQARATADALRAELASLERDLSKAVEQTDRELRQTRELAERLRLVPAELMFNALERAARDAATSLGKKVLFEAKGGDVRIDADVLAAIQSALVHVVTNAVAHGIESPASRAAAGKRESGRVEVEVGRRGARVAFACRDDGAGIDVLAVSRAADRKGRMAGGQAPSEADVLRLLLEGGISTSPSVTGVSGRGVGLDVVRETASRLGGEVSLRSEFGAGTTLEMLVPVSRLSIDALLVECGGGVAAVPLDSVRATLRLAPTDVTRTADRESIVWGGKVVSFAPLVRTLHGGPTDGAARSWSAMVIEGGGALAAVGVDRLVRTDNVVLRSLPKEVHARPVIGGACLDARGTPQPVLEPAALVASVCASRMAASAAAASRRTVLVVDDSLTTRMLEQSILESAGYEVDLAASGEEALAKTARRQYALFLVDVEMPGMDGFTFVERTRADPILRKTPAILVTSRAAPEDRVRGDNAGASGYIVKSEFDQNDLLERIRKLVG